MYSVIRDGIVIGVRAYLKMESPIVNDAVKNVAKSFLEYSDKVGVDSKTMSMIAVRLSDWDASKEYIEKMGRMSPTRRRTVTENAKVIITDFEKLMVSKPEQTTTVGEHQEVEEVKEEANEDTTVPATKEDTVEVFEETEGETDEVDKAEEVPYEETAMYKEARDLLEELSRDDGPSDELQEIINEFDKTSVELGLQRKLEGNMAGIHFKLVIRLNKLIQSRIVR